MQRAMRWAAMASVAATACFAPCAIGADSDTAAAAGPPPLASGDARLCFYRETWHALSVQPEVTVAGQVVGKAYPNEWFCVDRKPGTYEVSTVSEPDRKFNVDARERADALREPRVHGHVVSGGAHQSDARRRRDRSEGQRRTALSRLLETPGHAHRKRRQARFQGRADPPEALDADDALGRRHLARVPLSSHRQPSTPAFRSSRRTWTRPARSRWRARSTRYRLSVALHKHYEIDELVAFFRALERKSAAFYSLGIAKAGRGQVRIA